MKKKIAFFLTISLSLFSIIFPIENVKAIDLEDTPATQVIGQPDLSTNLNITEGLHLPMSILGVNNKIYISDYGCSGVAIYNQITQNQQAAIAALGQPSASDCYPNNGGITAHSFNGTGMIATDGTHLFVADVENNRVLIWNSIPTTNAVPADVVLGQPDMGSRTANNGGISAHSLSLSLYTSSKYSYSGIYSDGNKLYVSDSANNRVLIWNTIPTTNDKDADIVLGQPDMTHNTANNGSVSAHSLYYPYGITKINGKLYIADAYNNRVLIFNTEPATQANANVVLGQPDMTHNTANNGGVSAHSLYVPRSVAADDSNSKLIISDTTNHRVLIFNTIPSSNQADANVVIGQPDMAHNTANNGGISSHGLYIPVGVKVISGKLYIVDSYNNRALVFNTIPTSNQADADFVIGQPDFVSNIFRNGGPGTLSLPYARVQNGKLLIADSNNSRVLIWNSVPTSNLPLVPDVIVGQSDMTHNGAGVSAHDLNYVTDVMICNNKLIVDDYGNNRVLIWNTIPTTNQKDADVVIGQPDMAHNSENTGGLSAHSLDYPWGVACSQDNKLAIADLWNHRVLIYNSIPTTNQKDADVVLGQPDMTHDSANNGGISAHSLSQPMGVAFDDTRLFVADANNNRVLIWNTIPTTNQKDADLVLGQPDMSHNTVNNGGLGAQSLKYPFSVYSDNSRLFISDTDNNRVLGWSTFPSQNFQAADFVIGEPDFTTFTSDIDPGRLVGPSEISFYNNYIYISDSTNSRIQIFPTGPQNPTISTPSLTSSDNINVNLSADGAKNVKVSATDPTLASTSWAPYTATASVTLPGPQGTNDVYVQYQDYANYTSSVLTTPTILDQSPPFEDNFYINGGDKTTTSRYVTLSIEATDKYSSVTHMMISEDPSFTNTSWEPYQTTNSKPFTLTDNKGVKTIYIKYQDAAGNVSGNFSDSITLDYPSSGTSSCSNSVTTGTPDLFQITTTKGSATLYFSPPPMPYSSFYVAYSTKPNTWDYGVEFNQNYSSGVLTYTINSLKPNTKYYFEIRAGNGCATGAFGNTMSAATTRSSQKKTFYKNLSTGVSQTINSIISKLIPIKTKTVKTAGLIPTPTPQSSIQPTQPTKKKFCILWWCF